MRRFIVLVVLGLITAQPTMATVVTPVEFREIVAEASLIVRGTVTDVRVVSADTGVSSIATVAVEAVLKGTASAFVSVEVPGGREGRYRTVMVGAPALSRRTEALFFLTRSSDNLWRPVGLASGIARVERDAGGRRVVRAPVLLGRTASLGPVVRGDRRRRPVSVAEFEALVELVLAAQAGRGSARAR